MTNLGNKEVMAKNLLHYVTRSGKTQKEIAAIVGVAPSTFNDWLKAKDFSSQWIVNVQHILTAAVAVYTKRLTFASAIVLNIPMMGRVGTKAMNVPCTKVNMIPLRITIGDTDTFVDVCMQVKKKMRETGKHQFYRHEQMRRDFL